MSKKKREQRPCAKPVTPSAKPVTPSKEKPFQPAATDTEKQEN